MTGTEPWILVNKNKKPLVDYHKTPASTFSDGLGMRRSAGHFPQD
jgi:hypothetical protein